MKNKKKRKKSQTQKIEINFTDNKLTNYAGLVPVAQFTGETLGLPSLFSDELGLKRGNNINYTSYEMLSMFLAGVMAGGNRMSHIASITNDLILQKAFGWTDSPAPSTFGRYFERFGKEQVEELIKRLNQLRALVWSQVGAESVIVDMDSTVSTVYGHQEGAAKGYNPTSKGKKSYHPLLAFITETKEVLAGRLREGNTHSLTGAEEFIEEALDSLHEKIEEVLIRADSGFFSGTLMDCLEKIETRNCHYLIKVKLNNLDSLLARQEWKESENPDIQVTSFRHRCEGWSRSRRFVGVKVRRPLRDRGPILFSEEDVPLYEWFCFVTDLDSEPLRIYNLYKKRGTCENWIEEVKNHFYASGIRTRNFKANDALFVLSCLAYNIIKWMTYLTDRKSWREEYNTLRFWFVKVAGRLITTGRKFILRLQNSYPYRERWSALNDKVMELQLE